MASTPPTLEEPSASSTVKLDTSRLEPPFEMPSVLWSDGNPAHTLENTGPDDLHIIVVELNG